MGIVETRIVKAQFVFDSDCGLAIYLDCDHINKKDTGIYRYVTELFELNYIKMILNEGKTGHSKETFDQEQLNELVGLKAIFFSEEDGDHQAHFKYIVPNSKEVEKIE